MQKQFWSVITEWGLPKQFKIILKFVLAIMLCVMENVLCMNSSEDKLGCSLNTYVEMCYHQLFVLAVVVQLCLRKIYEPEGCGGRTECPPASGVVNIHLPARKYSVLRRGGRERRGRKQMRANANKRRQMQRRKRKQRQANASKRRQTQTNAYTPLLWFYISHNSEWAVRPRLFR